MPIVLCFDCGGTFTVPYGTTNPTTKCPKCKDVKITKNECPECEMHHKDPLFWESHQTMSDYKVWCVNAKRS